MTVQAVGSSGWLARFLVTTLPRFESKRHYDRLAPIGRIRIRMAKEIVERLLAAPFDEGPIPLRVPMIVETEIIQLRRHAIERLAIKRDGGPQDAKPLPDGATHYQVSHVTTVTSGSAPAA